MAYLNDIVQRIGIEFIKEGDIREGMRESDGDVFYGKTYKILSRTGENTFDVERSDGEIQDIEAEFLWYDKLISRRR